MCYRLPDLIYKLFSVLSLFCQYSYETYFYIPELNTILLVKPFIPRDIIRKMREINRIGFDREHNISIT